VKYQNPELLLVGAAHNLVLGHLDTKVTEDRINSDSFDGEGPYAVQDTPDSLGW